MSLWKLERLRLWRTQRLWILLAVFGSIGVLGPLTVRFLPELMESLGEEAVGTLPPMTAVDGVTQYIGNAVQIGVLAVAFVGAAAIAFDAKPEIAVFLRTRASVRDILIPRFATVAAAVVAMFSVGMAVAYVGTGLLLEWLDVGGVVIGTLLFSMYLVFVVAVIGLVASLVRRVPAVALLSVGGLIVFALVGIVGPIAPWLPSELIGATDHLVRGGDFEFWRSVSVTVVLTIALLAVSIRRLEVREL